MYLKWKGYTHGLTQITRGVHGFEIRREPTYAENGDPTGYNEVWDISGRLYNPEATNASMITRILAIERAYATGRGDAMLTVDGNTPTYHTLFNRDCLGGTKIIQPLTYPTTRGPENLTHRTFRVSIGGYIPLISGNTIIELREKVTFDGGGSEEDYMINRTHRPFPITKTLYMPYTAIQEGTAVGFGRYPDPPPPFWPHFWMRKGSTPFSYEIGRPVGDARVDYRVSWRYEFKSDFPLVGLPEYW